MTAFAPFTPGQPRRIISSGKVRQVEFVPTRHGLRGATLPLLPEDDDRRSWLSYHLDMACWELNQADTRPDGSTQRQYCLDMADHHYSRAKALSAKFAKTMAKA